MDKDHRERNVMVWGEPHIVTVCRKSDHVVGGIGRAACCQQKRNKKRDLDRVDHAAF